MITFTCTFCARKFTKKCGHTVHQNACKLNPDRIPHHNNFTKAKENGTEYIVSEETIEKRRIAITGKKRTVEQKQRTSDAMKIAVSNNPESYRGMYNRGNVKQIECSNGFLVIGSWEKIFVDYCLENAIEVVQPVESFSYVWEGNRSYFPDFYLPETDTYIEVKGMQTDRDLAKWDSITSLHNKNLIVVEKLAIKLIKMNQMNDLNNFRYN